MRRRSRDRIDPRWILIGAALLLLVAPHAAAVAGDQPLGELRSWLRRYKLGKIDLHQPLRVAVPTDASGAPAYYRSDAITELEALLERVAALDNVDAARLLLDTATHRLARDAAKERARHVDAQPWLVRRLAAEALYEVDDPDVGAWLTGHVVSDRSVRGADRRRVAALALAHGGHAGALDAITPLLSDEEGEVREAATVAIAVLGDPSAIPTLLEIAMKDERVGVRLEALLAVDRIAGDASEGPAHDARLQAASDALEDPHGSLRMAAAHILRTRRDRASIPTLVAALAREAPDKEGTRRRVRAALRDALVALTGEDFPSYRPADWAAWWDEVKDDFVLDADTEGEITKEQGARFFGIPIEADVVIFALDVSGSMKKPAFGRRSGPSRLLLATRELKRCLEDLPDGTRFNVVLFNDTVTPFAAAPVPNDEETTARALAFLDGPEAEGGTDLFGALSFSLGIGGEASRRVTGGEVDTLVLLSDGTPSRGAVLIPDEIRHQVARANRGRRVVIHTVHAASGEKSELLTRLAEENGGATTRLGS